MLNYVNLKDYLLLVFFFAYAVLLPGYSLARFLLPPKQLNSLIKNYPDFENLLIYRYFYCLFAPATGLILVDAVVLILAKFGQSLNFINYFTAFSIVNIILLVLNFWLAKPVRNKIENINSNFKIYILIFIVLWLGSVLVRTVFYLPNVVPHDIDLGHHMYWSQLMVQKETFPVYNTSEVIEGEHMIFAVLSKLSGISLLSAMPLLILSFYNLAMVLTLFIGSIALTANRKIGLWSLFFSGIYFAVDSPQARYVKGGVIGNTFGNLFIPLVFLLVFIFLRYFFKNISNKKELYSYKSIGSVISLILIIIAGSFYTHHLSTFLLGITLAVSFFVWVFMAFIWNAANRFSIKDTTKLLFNFFRGALVSYKFILPFLAIVFFSSYVYIPFYLRNKAIETVARIPQKDTHLGIPLTDLPGKLGWTRFALLTLTLSCLLASILILAVNRYKRINLGQSLLRVKIFKYLKKINFNQLLQVFLFLGWFLPLAVLSFYPQILKVDLPSRRVINYLVFPSLILASIASELIFSKFVGKHRSKLAVFLFVILGLAILWDGTSDFRSAYTSQGKFQETVELYSASNYLAQHTFADSVILKDHRTITGDSWIKFFLLRGYDYFLSRTYDYKYTAIDNTLDPCTREMITVPESNISQKCYGQTGINYVIVKPGNDEFLFWKGKNFNIVYISDNLVIIKS